MFDATFLKSKFDAGLSYDDYIARGKPDQQESWTAIYNQASLTPAQKKLVAGFTREMHVLCLSGIWCGDCVQQGPLLQRIAEGNPDKIRLRWLERDDHMDLAERIKINQGLRVPVVLFAAEDDEFVSYYGDRTLTRYRALAEKQLGPSCPLPGAPVPSEELAATLQDWLNEFERVQLLLRLSGRLRKIHND